MSRCRRAVNPTSNPNPSMCTPTCEAGLCSAENGAPSMVATPLVGRISPTIARSVVDLPAPLGPSNPTIEPRGTTNDKSRTAVVCP